MIPCLSTKIKLLFLICCIGFFSCKREPNAIGTNLIGSASNLGLVFDTTLHLNAYTVKMDSIETKNFTVFGLGKINDPDMGTTNASIVFQYNLPNNSFTWGGATSFDSLVLQLRFADLNAFYGDINQIHTLKVYELNEDLSFDSSYYHRRNYQYNKSEVGTWTGKFNLTDTSEIKLGSNTFYLPPHIRINLNSTYAQKLIQAETAGNFSSTSNFKKAFKGFIVVDETNLGSNKGGVSYIRLNSNVTALTAYYKDSLAADFPVIAGSEIAANAVEHSNLPANFLQQSFVGSHRDSLAIQSLFGTKIRIDLVDLLDSLGSKKVAINGAEILFSVLGDNAGFALPERLQLVASDTSGFNIFTKDLAFEGATYYGGSLYAGREYRFNIARHIQYLLSEYKSGKDLKKLTGLFLFIPVNNPFTAARVLLDGKKDNGKIKLKLTYTVLKN